MSENQNSNDECIQWSLEYLISRGHTLKSPDPEEVQITSWPYVARFAITDGYIYLKQTPPLLTLEYKNIKKLHEQLMVVINVFFYSNYFHS